MRASTCSVTNRAPVLTSTTLPTRSVSAAHSSPMAPRIVQHEVAPARSARLAVRRGIAYPRRRRKVGGCPRCRTPACGATVLANSPCGAPGREVLSRARLPCTTRPPRGHLQPAGAPARRSRGRWGGPRRAAGLWVVGSTLPLGRTAFVPTRPLLLVHLACYGLPYPGSFVPELRAVFAPPPARGWSPEALFGPCSATVLARRAA